MNDKLKPTSFQFAALYGRVDECVSIGWKVFCVPRKEMKLQQGFIISSQLCQ